MSALRCVVCVVVVSFLWNDARADDHVACVYMRSCMLPCTFTPGDDILIHWIYWEKTEYAHSYYNQRDQFEIQHPRFKDRTSLFKDQISNGNASLLLTEVHVGDEGRYKCYTSTNFGRQESDVTLSVNAPVEVVSITQDNDTLTCSSAGIYPKPEISWSPNNLTLVNKGQRSTEVKPSDQGLFTISSSVKLSDEVTEYMCNISTRSGSKTQSYVKASTTSQPGSDGVNKGIDIGGVIGAVIAVIVVIAVIAVIVCKKKKKLCPGTTEGPTDEHEMNSLEATPLQDENQPQGQKKQKKKNRKKRKTPSEEGRLHGNGT